MDGTEEEKKQKLSRARLYLGLLNKGWIKLADLNLRQFAELDAYIFALHKREKIKT